MITATAPQLPPSPSGIKCWRVFVQAMSDSKVPMNLSVALERDDGWVPSTRPGPPPPRLWD